MVWLPREDQLRTLLGRAFIGLESIPGGYAVTVHREDRDERHVDLTAEAAYARAVLALHA